MKVYTLFISWSFLILQDPMQEPHYMYPSSLWHFPRLSLFHWHGHFGGVLAGCLVGCPTTGNCLVFFSWLDWIYGFCQASQVVLVVKNIPARRHKIPGLSPWVRKIPWRRKWQSMPVFLPGESHGQRSLAGYSPWGHKELAQLSTCTKTVDFGKEDSEIKCYFFPLFILVGG